MADIDADVEVLKLALRLVLKLTLMRLKQTLKRVKKLVLTMTVKLETRTALAQPASQTERTLSSLRRGGGTEFRERELVASVIHFVCLSGNIRPMCIVAKSAINTISGDMAAL